MTRLAALAVFTAHAVVASPAGSIRGSTQGGRALTTTSSTEPAYPEEGTYEHVGCFQDSVGDRILGHKLRRTYMTPSVCHDHCNVAGAAYMATQFGEECWCSLMGDVDFRRHGVGVCDMFCSGDPEETCGGNEAFDLYRLDWPAESPDEEYMECYADSKDDRVMGDVLVQDDMTQRVCRDHCVGKNTMYYATQWANECWCGTSSVFADYERHGVGVCHSKCAGDEKVACGGHEAFSLFRFLDGADAEPFVDTLPDAGNAPEPTPSPVADPTPSPVSEPTPSPVSEPTPSPVAEPTPSPVAEPTPAPVEPTNNGGGGERYGEDFRGDGTYYGETTAGNCAIRAPIPSMYDGMIPVAIHYAEGDSQMCGACIEGTGSGDGAGANPITGPFKAYVSDKCPECAPSDLDFSMSGDGRWDIEWHFVECPGGGDPSFVFEGSNNFYWKIQPRGTKTPVKELMVNGIQGARTDDNFFIVQEGSPFYGEQSVETVTIEDVYRSSGVSL